MLTVSILVPSASAPVRGLKPRPAVNGGGGCGGGRGTSLVLLSCPLALHCLVGRSSQWSHRLIGKSFTEIRDHLQLIRITLPNWEPASLGPFSFLIPVIQFLFLFTGLLLGLAANGLVRMPLAY